MLSDAVRAARVLSAAAARDRDARSRAGKTLRLVVAHRRTPKPIRTEFADAFSRWHEEKFGQPVFVDYRIYGGASDIVRYFESARETLFKSLGTYQIDVVWGGGDDLFERRLREPGHLEGVRAER